jgi:hypothetical protein
MTAEIRELAAESGGQLPQYTCVGSYTMLYYSEDFSDVFCADCATEALNTDEPPAHYLVYLEGSVEYCCECGKELESSYGDPEENE